MEKSEATSVKTAIKSDRRWFYKVIFFLPAGMITICAIGIWFLWGEGWAKGSDFLSAFLIALVGAIAGSLVFWVTWRYWRGYLAQGVLAGMGVRMLLTLGGILFWAIISGKLEMRFLFLLLGLYVLGLVSETVIALKVSVRPIEGEHKCEKSLLNEK